MPGLGSMGVAGNGLPMESNTCILNYTEVWNPIY